MKNNINILSNLIRKKHTLHIKLDKKEISRKEFEKKVKDIEKKIKDINSDKVKTIIKSENIKQSKPVKQKTPREFSARNFIISSLKNKKIKTEKGTVRDIIKNKYGYSRINDKDLIKKTTSQLRNFISCVRKQKQKKVKKYKWDKNNYFLFEK